MKPLQEMTNDEFGRFLYMCAFSEMDEETITVINKETSRRWHVGVFGREPVDADGNEIAYEGKPGMD